MEKTFVYKDFIESASGGMADKCLDMIPGVNILWGGMKNAINGSKNMRILRGIDFLEGIANEDFLKELEESENALDGFAICLETYSKERNIYKRKIIKNIFLGYYNLSEEKKANFELERLLDINNKIIINEVNFLKKIKNEGKLILSSKETKSKFDNITMLLNFNQVVSKYDDTFGGLLLNDLIYGLISLGLIKQKVVDGNN